MSLKDDYVNKLKMQLDEWSAEIDVLESDLRKVDADLRARIEAEVVALKVKRDAAKVKLAEIQASAGEAWQELRKRNGPNYVRQPERVESIVVGYMEDFNRSAAVKMGIKARRPWKVAE